MEGSKLYTPTLMTFITILPLARAPPSCSSLSGDSSSFGKKPLQLIVFLFSQGALMINSAVHLVGPLSDKRELISKLLTAKLWRRHWDTPVPGPFTGGFVNHGQSAKRSSLVNEFSNLLCIHPKNEGSGDIIPANFLDFPPNFRLRTRF